jgi:hypothetical protein
MTDRVHSLTVVLTEDIREDEVLLLKMAILQLKGVLSVDQHVADIETNMAEQRALARLRSQLAQILWR